MADQAVSNQAVSDQTGSSQTVLDQGFEALAKLGWGADLGPLKPIDEAIVQSHGDSQARLALEQRLAAVLSSDTSAAAKGYACRQLMLMGTSTSISALAPLLGSVELGHMARYALERIPDSTVDQALRDAAGQLTGALKIGAINSLGARRDAGSAALLGTLLADSDAAVARAAALALGSISTEAAASALRDAQPTAADVKVAVTDAALSCADALMAEGKKAQALAIFKSFAGEGQPKHVRLAATRGMLAAARK